MAIKIHKESDFTYMRRAGKLAAEILDFISQYIQPGISTLELNDLCHDMIIKNNAIPAPLNYKGFPKSICTSRNNIVCHGIPKATEKLIDGDIINIDVTVILNGWHGDSSRTFTVGPSFSKKKASTIKAQKLVNITYEALMKGIEAAQPGNYFSDIGKAIQKIANKENYGVVKNYCGHGIGKDFHAEPHVLHYDATKDKYFKDQLIKPGMFFTIEPMINAGKSENFLSQKDDWTVYTKDSSLSAQFEHTIGINETGNEIFTLA